MSVDKGAAFLVHYGKKGMRWGNRKGTSQRTYNTKHLSNTELKAVINRMQLEQQYSSLNKQGRSGSKKFAAGVAEEAGKKFLGKVLANAASGTIRYSAIKSKSNYPTLSKALDYLIKGK